MSDEEKTTINEKEHTKSEFDRYSLETESKKLKFGDLKEKVSGFSISIQKQIDIIIYVFIIIIFTLIGMLFYILNDSAQDKELLFKYFETYNKYDDLNRNNLQILLDEQRIEINNLQNEIENLRKANPYLK